MDFAGFDDAFDASVFPALDRAVLDGFDELDFVIVVFPSLIRKDRYTHCWHGADWRRSYLAPRVIASSYGQNYGPDLSF